MSPPPERSSVARLFGFVVGAAGTAMVLAFFLFVDLDGTVRGRLNVVSLVAAAVWAGPFVLYAYLVRTRTIAVAGGAGLLAATAAFLVMVFRDTHSTAGIGVVTIPMLLYPLTVGVLAVDRVAWGTGRGEGRVMSGLVRGGLAAGLALVVTIAAVAVVIGIVSLFDREAGGSVVGTVLVTLVSAAIAIGGALLVRRLWRDAPASPRTRTDEHAHAGES